MKTDRREPAHTADDHREQIDLLVFGYGDAIKDATRGDLKAEPLWTVRSPFLLGHEDFSIARDQICVRTA